MADLKPRWISPREQMPERGQRVDWVDSSGNETIGGKFAGVWLLPDTPGQPTMYIYYLPTFWRPARE